LGVAIFRKFGGAPSKSYGNVAILIHINACVAYLGHSPAHPEVAPLRRALKRSSEALASFTEAPYPPDIDVLALLYG
jgi:hypothetical protein